MIKNILKHNIFTDRRLRTFTVALGLAISLLAPTFLNSYASAAQVTQRSINPSTSAKSATNVTYAVNFTSSSTGAAGAFVVEFCSNSPFVNSACTAPAGFDASTAASTTSGFTDVTGATNRITVAGTIAASTAISVNVTGITNPSVTGAFYARIVTYDTKAHALAYTSANVDAGAAHIDDGSAAVSINDTIGVTAAVLETMTFCVGKTVINNNCDLTGNSQPTIALGEPVGTVIALSPTAVSTGTVFTQISTNAANGAIVSMKSSATGCGGLKRSGYPAACDIAPAQNTDITAGQAKFGVKTAASTTGTNGGGIFEPVTGSYYSNSAYGLKYTAGDASGITSPYGDPFLDTAGAPANNINMQLTFGASITNNTPAGNYSTNINLIATGKF